MALQQHGAHATAPANREPGPAWPGNTAKAYELRHTLDSYRVEELDGHDLARLLPLMAAGEESRKPGRQSTAGPERD